MCWIIFWGVNFRVFCHGVFQLFYFDKWQNYANFYSKNTFLIFDNFYLWYLDPNTKYCQYPFLKISFVTMASVTTWLLSDQWNPLQKQHFLDRWHLHPLTWQPHGDPVNGKIWSESTFLPSMLTVALAFNSCNEFNAQGSVGGGNQ